MAVRLLLIGFLGTCQASTSGKFNPPSKPTLSEKSYWIKHIDIDAMEIITNESETITPAAVVERAHKGWFVGGEKGTEAKVFNQKWFGDLVNSFNVRGQAGMEDINAFMRTGLSHGMPLRMNLFSGPRNWNFGTHVHQNLEYMTVLAGTLYEHRSTGHVTEFPDVNVGLPAGGKYRDEVTKIGSREINEFGSLHTSYSKNDGVFFLTLYNGDWFFKIDGCSNVEFLCTPNGCGKSGNIKTRDEICPPKSNVSFV